MVTVILDPHFQAIFSKIKDGELKKRIINQIEKIKTYPEVGKPLRNVRRGTRELHVPPFRLSYEYFKDKDLVYILDFYHKDEQ